MWKLEKVVYWKAIRDAAAQQWLWGGGIDKLLTSPAERKRNGEHSWRLNPPPPTLALQRSPPLTNIIGRQTCAATEWMEESLHLWGIKVCFISFCETRSHSLCHMLPFVRSPCPVTMWRPSHICFTCQPKRHSRQSCCFFLLVNVFCCTFWTELMFSFFSSSESLLLPLCLQQNLVFDYCQSNQHGPSKHTAGFVKLGRGDQ